jgi:hypothetical protein
MVKLVRTILVGTLLVLSSCATTAKYEKKLQSWVGSSEEQLIMSWGVPSQTYQMPNGGKALVFGFQGQTTSYATYNQFMNGYQVWSNTPVCVTTFFVDPAGLINNWRWQGNSCRSE